MGWNLDLLLSKLIKKACQRRAYFFKVQVSKVSEMCNNTSCMRNGPSLVGQMCIEMCPNKQQGIRACTAGQSALNHDTGF